PPQIAATNVAANGLNLPFLNTVVDTVLEKMPRQLRLDGFTSLETVVISRYKLEQRRGTGGGEAGRGGQMSRTTCRPPGGGPTPAGPRRRHRPRDRRQGAVEVGAAAGHGGGGGRQEGTNTSQDVSAAWGRGATCRC